MTRVRLGEICERLSSGKSIKAAEVQESGTYPVIGGNGLRGYAERYNFDGECAVIGRQGAACGNVRFHSGKAYMTEHAVVAVANESNDSHYLAYLLSTMSLGRLSAQSAQPGLSVKTLSKQEIDLPSLEKQRQVVKVIGSIDDKIGVNAKLNGYLLELATARFESALKTKSKTVRFGDIVALEDSKRIPLNSRDREARKGPYPYYGATSIMDYVDDFLFDEIRVLLGEDGTVVNSEGKPILQYVWGKYWVNNHAHILASSGEYSLEAIYVALKRTAINQIVTGAVQMKISQRNLKSLELEMPSSEELGYLQDLFAAYRSNQDENTKLAALRDALLPRLMSGEIDVSKVDLTQLNSHLA